MSPSIFAAALLVFFALFTSASPTNAACSGLDYGSGKAEYVLALATDTHYGTATWFNVGLGACGVENTDDDFIVALAQPDWDGGSHCGQELQITNPSNGRVETATVRDLCPGCPSGNLDLSPGLFRALADDLGLGVFEMSWQYV